VDENEIENIAKMVANQSHVLSQPLDLEKLIQSGVIKQVGKSYYVDNLASLPNYVRLRIKSISKGKYGQKVEFIKPSKSMEKLAKKFEHLRD
jgi:hypothetical protein